VIEHCIHQSRQAILTPRADFSNTFLGFGAVFTFVFAVMSPLRRMTLGPRDAA
jgi:hypothetical protein